MKVFMHFLSKSTLLISTTLLAACGGGGGGTPVAPIPTTMAECYALTAGNSLQLTQTPSVNAYVLNGVTTPYPTSNFSITNTNGTFGGAPVILRRSVNTANGNYGEQALKISATAYERVGFNNYTATTGATTVTNYSNYIRTLNVSAGNVETRTFTATPVGGTASAFTVELTFVGVEDVTTPHGTYKNACKQTFKQTNPINNVITSETLWYAPGYGNVKQVAAYNYTDGRVPAAVTFTTQ
jgi:hypothetical protein